MFSVATWSNFTKFNILFLLLPNPYLWCQFSCDGSSPFCLVTNPADFCSVVQPLTWAQLQSQKSSLLEHVSRSVVLSPVPPPHPEVLHCSCFASLGLFLGKDKCLCTSEVRTSHFRWLLILAHVDHELIIIFIYGALILMLASSRQHLQLILVSLEQQGIIPFWQSSESE